MHALGVAEVYAFELSVFVNVMDVKCKSRKAAVTTSDDNDPNGNDGRWRTAPSNDLVNEQTNE